MIDKVQKIKEWIGKKQDSFMDAQGNFEYPEHEGAYHILCNLDAYIDSLQKEPVSEDLETELNKYIKDNFTIDKEQLDRFGIEEKDYMYSMDKNDILALVEHFTNLQKTKEESVSEMDLNKELSFQWSWFCFNDKDRESFVKVAKHFFELGFKAKGEIYVVTRSEEHSDYVEAVFLSENKAEEYCNPFNEDEDCYARHITKVKIQ